MTKQKLLVSGTQWSLASASNLVLLKAPDNSMSDSKNCLTFQICIFSLIVVVCCSKVDSASQYVDDESFLTLAEKLEYFYDRNTRSPMYNKKCHHRNDHYAAYGKWANTVNSTHGLAMILPIIPRATMRTVVEEDMTGLPILAGSIECPDQPSDDPYDHGSIMARSLCPWYWRVNYDPQRIPAVLPEAVCRCPRAVTGNRIVAYECQPLVMNLRVLRFDSNCLKYTEQTIEIAMACVSTVHSSRKLFKFTGIEETLQEIPPIDD